MADFGLDFAWSKPPISLLQANGVKFVSRYLSWLPNGKVIDAAEYNSYKAAGIEVFLNWEYAANDELGGAAAGHIQATEAVRQAQALGYPKGATIYYSGDFDETPAQGAPGGPVSSYFGWTGVAAVTKGAGYRIGAYGDYYYLQRLFDQKLIDDGWQTYAWSGGQWEPRAAMRQIHNGFPFSGYDVDQDQRVGVTYSSLHPYVAPTPAPEPAPVPEDDEVKNVVIAQDGPGGPIYVGDFVSRRWIKTEAELSNVKYWINKRGGDATVNVFVKGTVDDVLGVLVGPDAPAPVAA